MMVTVEGALRRILAWGKQQWVRPGIRAGAAALGWAGGGLVLSAAGLRGQAQPFALGLILSLSDWRAMAACLGSLAGYRLFWDSAGEQALWWTLGAGLLALLGGKRLLPLLAALVVSSVGVFFRFFRQEVVGTDIFLLRLLLAGGATWVFCHRDRVSRWLRCGIGTLALAQLAPGTAHLLSVPVLGALAAGASFPAAAMAGLGLDLAGAAELNMTALAVLGWLGRLLTPKKQLRWLLPAGAGLVLMAALGQWEWQLLPGLLAGGALGMLLPAFPAAEPRRGETGLAQVRLELAAGVMAEFQKVYLTLPPPAIDRGALLQRLRSRACGSCSARKHCLEQQRLTVTILEDTRNFPCRKAGRLKWELNRAREQLRLLRADHRRREEYRCAMVQQYRFLSEYLQNLSDQLPRRAEKTNHAYGVTVCVRTRGRQRANGDRWAAFPGSRGRYYVLLCDGMGTGAGAEQESRSALQLLRQLLSAQFRPEQALRCVNSMLTLTGRSASVTVDLAELRLDTGQARLYKWGAAPSWRVSGGSAEKIGTAGPPPGLSVTEAREANYRLSLRRGEMLILISDGVDGEDVPRRVHIAPDAPPGELAEKLLEGVPEENQDDATAAVIRLYPRNLASS